MRFTLPSLVLAACLALIGGVRAESTLDTVLKRGTFIVGTTIDAPPHGYLDPQGRQLGYCADVARYLARRMGVKVQFVQITAATRIPLLTTGRIDAEVAVTTPNKVRNEVVDFTYSYIWDEAVLLVRQGDSTNPADYIGSAKVIGAPQGNGFIDNWKKASPQATFKLYREEPDTVLALKKGEVAAVLTNQFSAVRFARSGGLAYTAPWRSSPDAIMVRLDDSRWRNWLDWGLQRMVMEGTLQKLYKKWYDVEMNFHLGDNGQLQQRVDEIGAKDDPWQALPAGFLDTLLGDKSYTLD